MIIGFTQIVRKAAIISLLRYGTDTKNKSKKIDSHALLCKIILCYPALRRMRYENDILIWSLNYR